ncbi:MAG: hypothetical protein ACIAQF_04050 [Phycisphaerales bacterium JB065]
MPSVLSRVANMVCRVIACSPGVLVGGFGLVAPAALVVSSEAWAQEWQYAGWYDRDEDEYYEYSYSPDNDAPITVRDLKMYASVLGLDEMQMEIMHEAFADFDRAFRREWVVFAEARDDQRFSSRYGDDDRSESAYERAKRTYKDALERIEEQFYGDLRLVLNATQLERWKLLEREQRRSKTLAEYAVFDEERVDLVASVQALDLGAEQLAALEPLLEEYREQMDIALVARNRKAETLGKRCVEVEAKVFDWSSVDRENPEEVKAMYEAYYASRKPLVSLGLDLYRACGRVRDVNKDFRRRIEEALPSEMLEDFHKVAVPEGNEDLYDSLYADYSRARMMFSVLENLQMYIASMQMQMDMWGSAESEEVAIYLRRLREVQPLTETQRHQIAQIRAEWEAEREAISSRYQPVAKPEPEEDRERYYIQLTTPQGSMSLRREVDDNEEEDWDDSEDVAEADRMRELNKNDQRSIEQLRQILTIEQRSLFVLM